MERRRIGVEERFGLLCNLVSKLARHDTEVASSDPTLAADLGDFAYRLLELDYEVLQSAYSKLDRLHDQLRYDDSGDLRDATNPQLLYMAGAVHALSNVVGAKIHEIDRIKKREQCWPYLQCFMAIVDELQEYTAVEFYHELCYRTFPIARASDDQEFMWNYDEDSSGKILFDLMNLLTSPERQRFNQKLRSPTRRLKEGQHE